MKDRIIAYFDGRMTDGESAELLHRVSVSPEIRKLFREHEMLRELARSAQASTVVRPELEASLFSRIDALAAAELAPPVAPIVEERRRKAIPIFWTRWRLGLATAVGAFVLGTAITLGPELFDGSNASDKIANKPTTDAPVITPKDEILSEDGFAEAPKTPSKPDFNKIIRGDRDYEARQVPNERPALHGKESVTHHESFDAYQNTVNSDFISDLNSRTNEMPISVKSAGSEQISSVDVKRNTRLNLGGEKGILPVFRAEDIEQDEANFEAAIETSSGFSYPASGPGIQPFADPRISVGYFLDRQNIIGVRLTSGLFQALPDQHETRTAAYKSITRDLAQERMYHYGAYYSHRFFGVLSDLMNLDASVGAGLISSGYTISGELGLRLPFSSKFFGNVSFALTRVHINAPTMDEITNSVSVEDGPVLIEGSDVQNTINGRIHYGLSYQF
jgi:hypothetical protein